MKVNYAHLCEKAFLSQNGNLNLIGIFEHVTSHQYPLSFSQLCIVMSLTGIPENQKMTIKIVKSKTKEEIIKNININISVNPKLKNKTVENQSIRIIGDINKLTLKEPGKFEVQIFLNDEKAATIPFTAIKHPKPIPKGR